MKKAIAINVYGRVQGVGFRYYTNKKANELNICGYVKNLTNGNVYIEAEAEENDLLTFVDWVKVGTQWARVQKVETQSIPPLGLIGFKIK